MIASLTPMTGLLNAIRRGPGKSTTEDGVQELLLACHARIRHFLAVADRVARAPATADELRDAASTCFRYFTLALPLHAQDEDLSLRPRLERSGTSTPPAVLQALSAMTQEHERVDAGIAELGPALQLVAETPARRAELAGRLGASVDALRATLEPHIAVEEHLIFPAVPSLPRELLAEIAAEMRARRNGA